MQPKPAQVLVRSSIAAACCAGLAGCAGVGGHPNAPASAAIALREGVSTQAAAAAIVPGQSKDSVRAALGKAIEIKFDSGYEVWVYRGPESARRSDVRTEFVILFAPSGLVKKTRVRSPDSVPVR